MKTLLDQTQIGTLNLKNRFIRSATMDRVLNGQVSQNMKEIYRRLAEGGVGTIITGLTLVDEREKAASIPAMYSQGFIPENQELTAEVHRSQVNILMQLAALGSATMGGGSEQTIWGPSAVANLQTRVIPQAMSLAEIKTTQEKFAQAAVRAQEAGYDGIQLHAAHGFMLHQFLSPYYNQRKDQYGGSVENRARMVLETTAGVKEAVGSSYPVWVKLNCWDDFEGGMSFADCQYICRELTKLKVDALEISGNWLPLSLEEKVYFQKEAAIIAAENSVAVIVVGGSRNFAEMERILNESKIGYFGLARPFIAEPDLVQRYEKGNQSQANCISCNGCCEPMNNGECTFFF